LRQFTRFVQQQKPFFTVQPKLLLDQINLWKYQLPNIQPHYAVKCNNDDILLKQLVDNDINFDCASLGEIKQIINLGIDSNKIIYANPYKGKNDFAYAVKNKVPLTVVDSVEELQKIQSQLKNKQIETLIRLKVEDKDSLMPFSSKFGASYEEAISILKLAKKLNINIPGFSFHVGSGCYNPNQYFEAVKLTHDVMHKSLQNIETSHKYSIVDIGGGFTGSCDEKFIDQANKIKEGIKLFKSSPNLYNNLRFISEPGRFFMTKSHTLYVPIIAKRKTNGKIFYIVDESIYSSFSNIIFDMAKPDLKIISKVKNSKLVHDSVIFGRTCDSADKVLEMKLPELEIGNYFEIKNMGAYTTASSTNFNGFETTEKIYLC